ncbi:MAG: tetratricopeptide repeat protein [Tepidisphaeraceae bacterium]
MARLTIQQAFDLALQHHQAGRLREAEQLYRQILARQPEHADAMHLRGVIAHQMGRNDVAVDLIRRAIALNPNSAEAHSNLGIVLKDKGILDEAIVACRQAIRLKPDFAEAHTNLGNALQSKGRLDEAVASHRQAIRLKPESAEAHSNLGGALKDNGQLDEAVAACRQAIALRGNYAEAHNNLGNALTDKGQLDEAIAACRQAVALKPNLPEAHNNLGNALRDKGQFNEALAAYRQAIVLRPSYAEAHFNLALALLLRGDFQAGWEEYEWRWKCKDFSSPVRDLPGPQWDGSPMQGRVILLYAEQGLGDALQFIRYLPLVEERGGKIIVECQAELQRLFQTMAGRCQVVASGQPLPDFDLHCPLLSLPRVFGTNLANIPNIVPYLSPDPALVDAWSRTLGHPDGQLRVGLAWAGSARFKHDRTRSLNLQQLAPLLTARGVKFYSLQKGPAGEQAIHPAMELELIDLGPELSDFADTAAVMSLMDLIITTDTSVPHLAGALGRPVWAMLQFAPDFRWLLEREDSPWYPTMRLFRQATPGDWDGVIRRVAAELSRHKSNRG